MIADPEDWADYVGRVAATFSTPWDQVMKLPWDEVLRRWAIGARIHDETFGALTRALSGAPA